MFKRIPIVVGAGPISRTAVSAGVALAQVHEAEALFFSVLPRYIVPVADMPMNGMLSPDDFQREVTRSAVRFLVADQAGVRSEYAVGAGFDDAECIVGAARTRRCDVIVVASAGRNAVMRLLSGSVIPGLVTLSTIPVLVVRQVPAGTKVKRPCRGAFPAQAASSQGGGGRPRTSAHGRLRRLEMERKWVRAHQPVVMSGGMRHNLGH